MVGMCLECVWSVFGVEVWLEWEFGCRVGVVVGWVWLECGWS